MIDKYKRFADRYNATNIQFNRDRRNFDYYNKSIDYYSDREETVDMEIPRRSFEHLVEIDDEYTKLWQSQRDERYMREEHPAIKEAYEKYRMLLELYK